MEILRVQLELRMSSASEQHSQHCHTVAACWCTPWHVWASPCLWESVEPALQLRDSTNARLELSDKMADGAHQERPHQHHLWRSWQWPTEELHAHTPFWAVTLRLRDSTNARLELSLTIMADGAHQERPHQHHLWRSWHWPTKEPHANTPFEQHYWWFIRRQNLEATTSTSQIHKCIKQNQQWTMTH